MKLFANLLLLSLICQVAIYSQSIKTDIKTLSQNADAIVTGEVVAINSNWGKDKSTIYTDVTLKVDEYIKGNNSQESIIVRCPGGEVDGVGELYSHMPSFTANEEVLLFVKKGTSDMEYSVLDGEEGKIQIAEDRITGEKTTALNMKISVLKAQIKSYVQVK